MQRVHGRGLSPPQALATGDERARFQPEETQVESTGATRGRVLVRSVVIFLPLALVLSGCALQEVRGKTMFGTEWRHSGNASTSDERYTELQGIELKWDKGISTSAAYRRRDVNEGNGDKDDGVFLEISYPLWKAPKKEDATAKKVAALEREIEELRASLSRLAEGARIDESSGSGLSSSPRVAAHSGAGALSTEEQRND